MASIAPSRYRWAILALGAGSTAALAAAQSGLPALGPALHTAFGLSLVEVTGVFTAFGLGTVLTVYSWGVLADRVGERVVLALGPAVGGAALAAVTLASGYLALLAGMFVAGLFAAAATSGSGRAVFGWFPRDERGLALGLRQTAVPVGAAAASFSLPVLAAATSLDVALMALAGALVVSSAAAALWLRDPPPRRSAAPPAPPAARDPRIWRLGAASALLIVGQVGVSSLLVLYLFTERGWSATEAALSLGVIQLGGAVARVAAGRWSDQRDERIQPFRRLAAGAGALLLSAALLANAASGLFVPLVMAGGMFAMSWNGLSFTAAAEISGGAQAGRAMGLQNTLMRGAGAAAPLLLGTLAASVSWQLAFLVMGLAPLAGAALLGPLVADEDRRRHDRRVRLAGQGT
ncbi:MAG TPA: MFS transporter [Thermoleophilaceae bacterium]|nr:MFS transporter [Thermoleophilaceae bacterium]